MLANFVIILVMSCGSPLTTYIYDIGNNKAYLQTEGIPIDIQLKALERGQSVIVSVEKKNRECTKT